MDYARQIIGESGDPIIVVRNLHGNQAGKRISPEKLHDYCVGQYGNTTVTQAQKSLGMEQDILSGKKWTGIGITIELV